MKYVCLVYHDERKLRQLSVEELEGLTSECAVWADELAANGHYLYSAALQSVRTAATVRCRNGEVRVTDGPFAETKEFLGGFSLFEARDLNEAVHIASKLPAARIGSIEVRPLLDTGCYLGDSLDQRLAAAMERAAHG